MRQRGTSGIVTLTLRHGALLSCAHHATTTVNRLISAAMLPHVGM